MPKRILLADDSITIQKVVELTFSDGDYEIVTANNGARALQKLSESIPDIILSDIIMPERNGYEVCEFVKSHPQYRNIPVILLTGTFEPFDPDRAEKAGCDAVVTKPFESQALINKVEELIAARRRGDDERRSRPSDQAPPPPPAQEPPPPAWNIPTFTPFPAAQEPAPVGIPDESPFSSEPWADASSPSAGSEAPFESMPAFGAGFAPGAPPSDAAEPFAGSPEVYEAETRAFPVINTPEPMPQSVEAAESEPAAEPDAEPVVRDFEEEDAWAEAGSSPSEGAPPFAVSEGEPMARTLQFPTVTGEWAAPEAGPSAPISPEPFIAGWTPQEESARPEPLPTQAIPVPAETADEDFIGDEEDSIFEPMEEAASASASEMDEPEPIYSAGDSFEEAAEEQPFAPAEEPEEEEQIYAQQPEPLEFPVTEQAPLIGMPSAQPQPGNGLSLTDAEIEKIARRVVELMSDQLVRNIAWEVIPDVAEAVVRERVRELEENH